MGAKDTSWGSVADWYDEHLSTDEDSYHRKVILPNLLRAMDVQPRDRVVDLACGTGFFVRELYKTTQQVLGVDISEELIAKAQIHGATGDQSYVVSSADDLKILKGASVDKISLVLAIQNIEFVGRMFAECARVLTSSGSMYIVMNHPTFRIPKATSWGWDEKNVSQYRRVDAYLSESKNNIDMHPGDKNQKDTTKTISFHRPLQFYVKAFGAHGFMLARLEEWISHKKSTPGVRQKEEDRIRKEIPLFMFLHIKRVN